MEGRISIKYLANKVEIYKNIDKNTYKSTTFFQTLKRTYDLINFHFIHKTHTSNSKL